MILDCVLSHVLAGLELFSLQPELWIENRTCNPAREFNLTGRPHRSTGTVPQRLVHDENWFESTFW